MSSISIKPYSFGFFSFYSQTQNKRERERERVRVRVRVRFRFFNLDNPKINYYNKKRSPLLNWDCNCKYVDDPHSGIPRLALFKFSNILKVILSWSWSWSWSCLQDPAVEYMGRDDDGGNKNGLQVLQGVDDNRLPVLRCGTLGMALVTFKSSLARNQVISTLAANPTFMSGLLACVMAQSIKVILNFYVERKWDWRLFCASGGMPSSHSALSTALTTSVALSHGLADSLFPVSLGFTLIVMYDSIGVRRHAGIQAEVLNKIIADLFQGHPISQTKLKELLGHTPSQVVAGALLGILVACFCSRPCLLPP